jgi:hypothetical protein
MATTKITVPQSYDQITLGDYVAYKMAKNDFERLTVVTKKPKKFIDNLQADSIDEILAMYELATVTGQPKHESHFLVDAKRFGFIPDMDALTFREHVDLDAYATQIWKDGEVHYEHLVSLCSILFRPVTGMFGKYYDISVYDADKVKRDRPYIENITMDRVNGALVFFSTIAKELVTNSLDSLEVLRREMIMMATQLQVD